MANKKKYAIEETIDKGGSPGANVTNNNLIVSTADLLKMMKGEGND